MGNKTVWEFWKERSHAPAVNRTTFLGRSARSRVIMGTEQYNSSVPVADFIRLYLYQLLRLFAAS